MKLRILSMLLVSILASCTNNHSSEDAVPRRYAYPRVATLGTDYTLYSVGSITTRINSEALVSRPGDEWLDAAYPKQKATLHLTAIISKSEAELAEAILNRRERISLNLGNARATISEFTNDKGFACEIISYVESNTTPVQILAIGPKRELISGAFVMRGSSATADSIRPVVAELEKEAFSILNNLSER